MFRQFIYYQDVILIRADTGRKMLLFKENKIVTGREKEEVTIEEEPAITDRVGKTADPAAAKTKAEAVQEEQEAGSIDANEKISSIVQHPLIFWAHFRRNFINFFRLAPSKKFTICRSKL